VTSELPKSATSRAPDRAEIRVLVADDFPATRSGLQAMLETMPGVEVVGTAVDGREAVDLAVQLKADLVLMDVSMPRLNGFDAAVALRQTAPHIKVLIVSVHDSPIWRENSLAHGACGFVSKCRVERDLLAEIRRVMNTSHPE
jgi:DNA-binding NarL/FixJ family response regulator